ncbi:MAG: NAD-dependent epimerase/dehydratase family protein [Deltaproteobacteria bacterium]|nr:MAG: NAD-dependent epimerase/dehydratase family protein [Deltaproteobacteria bacterium]
MPDHVLVTGGCGFIGTRLCARLLREGARVRVFDNLSVGRREDLEACVPVRTADRVPMGEGRGGDDGAVALWVGDIRDAADLAAAARGADVVVHLAAHTGVIPSVEDPRMDCEANVLGTLNALEAARAAGARNFVFASSGAPLGAQEPPIHEDKLPKPVSPYGASKLAGEAYCHVYAHTYGLRTAVLRFGNVYGPGSRRKGSVVAKFLRQALAGEPLTVYGDGSQTRDFIHVDDLVEAICRAAALDVGGEVFQIATGAETTVSEIVEAVRAALADLGRTVEVVYTEPRRGEVHRNFADVRKAARVLGWRARFSDIEAGIRDTLRDFLDASSP